MLGTPCGTVSRTGYGTPNLVLGTGDWGGRIETYEDSLPKALISISNSYASGSLSSTIECKALQDIQGICKLTVYIVEDSIVGAQITQNDPNYPDNIIHDYVFRDVLRGSLNGTWGQQLSSGNIAKGTTITKTYSTTLNSAWVPEHCSVIAFMSDSTTYEIIQAEEKKVK
jgi:hypothetical protein